MNWGYIITAFILEVFFPFFPFSFFLFFLFPFPFSKPDPYMLLIGAVLVLLGVRHHLSRDAAAAVTSNRRDHLVSLCFSPFVPPPSLSLTSFVLPSLSLSVSLAIRALLTALYFVLYFVGGVALFVKIPLFKRIVFRTVMAFLYFPPVFPDHESSLLPPPP